MQNFVLQILEAAPVVLPDTLSASDGPVGGAAPSTPAGQQLVITGGGCAAGAPVTVGYYDQRTVLGQSVADAAGNFSITATAPTASFSWRPYANRRTPSNSRTCCRNCSSPSTPN